MSREGTLSRAAMVAVVSILAALILVSVSGCGETVGKGNNPPAGKPAAAEPADGGLREAFGVLCPDFALASESPSEDPALDDHRRVLARNRRVPAFLVEVRVYPNTAKWSDTDGTVAEAGGHAWGILDSNRELTTDSTGVLAGEAGKGLMQDVAKSAGLKDGGTDRIVVSVSALEGGVAFVQLRVIAAGGEPDALYGLGYKKDSSGKWVPLSDNPIVP